MEYIIAGVITGTLLAVVFLQKDVINGQKRMLDLNKQRNAFLNENIVVVKKQSK